MCNTQFYRGKIVQSKEDFNITFITYHKDLFYTWKVLVNITLEAEAMWGTTIAFFISARPGFMYGSSWCNTSYKWMSWFITWMWTKEYGEKGLFFYSFTSKTSKPTRNIGFSFKCCTRAVSSTTGPLLQFTRIASYKFRFH